MGLLRLIRYALTPPVVPPKLALPRSPHWPAVRREHLVREPECQVCAGTAHLEVHHILPVHLFPGTELSTDNLLTACEAPGRNCHLLLHGYNWSHYDPEARETAAWLRERLTRVVRDGASPRGAGT